MSKYHIYARKLIDSEGKQYKIWYYWYWENNKRIRKPAAKEGNRAPHLKREALEFIEELERQDKEKAKNHPSPLGPSSAEPLSSAPRTFKGFAETLYHPGASHLKRIALTDGAEISEETRKGHLSRLTNYLIPKWGERTWEYFESESFPDDFTDWLVDLPRIATVKAGKESPYLKTISNSSRNALVETMTIALREAKRARLIRSVPKLERFVRHSRHQDTLTDYELQILFPEDRATLEKIWRLKDGRDYSTGVLFGAMCCLGVSAGLRSGELRAITFDQIVEYALPSGEIVHGLIIDKAINTRGEFVRLKKAKEDDPRERAVILSDKTMRIMNLYLQTINRSQGFVFLHRGKPVRKETLARRWAAGLKQAGIDIKGRRLTPHAMRYTYNTKMKMLLPDQILREVIGHRSEEMTTLYDRPHLEERLLQLADQRLLFERFWNT